MMHYLTFAGRSTHDFGIWISGESTFSAPERNVESQEVAGRNGSLLFDKGNFKNMTVKYPAFIKEGMPNKIRDFLNFFMEIFCIFHNITKSFFAFEKIALFGIH